MFWKVITLENQHLTRIGSLFGTDRRTSFLDWNVQNNSKVCQTLACCQEKMANIAKETSWFNGSFGIPGILVPCQINRWRIIEIFLTFHSKNDVRRSVPLITKKPDKFFITLGFFEAFWKVMEWKCVFGFEMERPKSTSSDP